MARITGTSIQERVLLDESRALRQELRERRAENERLRAALEAIKRATVAGKVCDDVAWFDGITTLYDYCDLVLNGGTFEQSAPVTGHGFDPKTGREFPCDKDGNEVPR